MSRRKRRKHLQANPEPNISMFGTALDRLLNGQVTGELSRQLATASNYRPTTTKDVLTVSATPFTPKPADLVIIMQETLCACGDKTTHFGYFARRVVTHVSNGDSAVSYKFIEKPFEKPTHVRFEQRKVPYCQRCIPNGLGVLP